MSHGPRKIPSRGNGKPRVTIYSIRFDKDEMIHLAFCAFFDGEISFCLYPFEVALGHVFAGIFCAFGELLKIIEGIENLFKFWVLG